MKFSACCTTQSKQSRRRAHVGRLLATICIASLGPGLSPGQETKAGVETIEQLSATNSLDAADLKPWHLRVAFASVDDKGQHSDPGIFEEWWAAPNRSRLEVSSGGQKVVTLHTPEGVFSTPGGRQPTMEQDLLLAQVVHPVSQNDLQGAIPELRNESFGKVKLQCTMLTRPFHAGFLVPTGLFPTFCAEGDRLRVVWLSTNIDVVSDGIGRFQGHVVPTKIVLKESGKERLDGHIEQLTTTQMDSLDLKIEGLQAVPAEPLSVGDEVMRGRRISGGAPLYPAEARLHRISGTVNIDVIIGADGRVHAPTVTSSPDGQLSLAALIALQQWVYQPFLVNGIPATVRTTLTVNFHLNPS